MHPTLAESQDLLVRRWGEMGGYWGISRSMAEIHALLFVCGRPLCTDDIMAQLHVSRGNASMNLRGLVDWGLVRRVHHLGDRKEYFEADTDVWRMFETITRERRRREVEPIIATIDRCRTMVSSVSADDPAQTAQLRDFRRRLEELRNFLATMGALFELVLRFGSDGMQQFAMLLATPGLLGGATASTPAGSPPAAKSPSPASAGAVAGPARRPRAPRAAKPGARPVRRQRRA
jgi:DNA-binding transcriptional regulator GbsR (MarR family)